MKNRVPDNTFLSFLFCLKKKKGRKKSFEYFRYFKNKK